MPAGGSKSPISQETIDARSSYITMKGSMVLKYAIKNVTSALDSVCEKANLSLSDIDYLVPHQANVR